MIYENTSDYISKNTVDKSSVTFGVSVPTINRWKSKQEFPRSSEIVIELLNLLDVANEDFKRLQRDKKHLDTKIETFSFAFKDLLK